MSMVSIVIPVYNTSKYLSECLNSLINQTYENLEIVCVDDESTDNSLDILKRYAGVDSRIKVYSKKNDHKGGAASARNFGLEKATGKYIMFLDSDDFFEIDMIEKMVEKAEKNQAEIVICGAQDFDDISQKVVGLNKKIEVDLAPNKECFSYQDCPKYIFQIAEFIAWNKLFSLKLIRSNNLFFESIPISDDQYLPALALVLAKRITIVDEHFINYRINTGTSQVDSQARHPEAAYQATYSIVKRFKELGVYEAVKQSYINITLRLNRLYFDRMQSLESLAFLHKKYIDDVWVMLEAMELTDDYFYDPRLAQWYKMIKDNSVEDILFKVCNGYGSNMTTAILRFQFPYEKVTRGSKIVLVGKGLVGRYWYAQLLLSNYAEVVYWAENEADVPSDILFDDVVVAK